MAGSMSALMEALKRREGSAGLDGMGDAPAKPDAGTQANAMGPSDMSGEDNDSGTTSEDSSNDPDDEGGNSAANNSKIVDILQSTYPRIFAKINAMIHDDPEAQPAEPTDAPSFESMG